MFKVPLGRLFRLYDTSKDSQNLLDGYPDDVAGVLSFVNDCID